MILMYLEKHPIFVNDQLKCECSSYYDSNIILSYCVLFKKKKILKLSVAMKKERKWVTHLKILTIFDKWIICKLPTVSSKIALYQQ